MAPRRRTVVLSAAAVLLSLVVALVGSVVVLTQTDRGMAFILRLGLPLARAAMPGRLYVAGLHGNLFQDITLDTIDLRAPDGTPLFSSGPLRVTYDPRDLLDGRIVIKSLEVTRPRVTLVDYGKDDWNLWRAVGRSTGAQRTTARATRFGRYIVLDTATIHELTFVARLPWTLSDTLKGAKRDSALTEHLTRLTDEFRAEDGRYVKVMRFVRGSLALGRSRLRDPDSAGVRLAVRKLDVVWMSPPLWFQGLSADARILGDTLWMDGVRFALPGSRATGSARVVWGSNLPMRYDIRLQGDTVSLTDLAWIDETIPHEGGGRMDLHIRNDPRALSIMDYVITNMDARSLRSRLRGRMTWGVGGPVTRLTDVDLTLAPAHTDLLRWFNGEPFPYDWRGALTGTVRGRGGVLTNWRLDDATVAFADEHVPGAVSRLQATGSLDILRPADAVLDGLDLTIAALDLRTPRFVNPLFPEINGIARGSVRLDSLWYDARFSQADIELVDGPGLPSRFTGSGRYTLVPEGTLFDVDLQALPLSWTTLSRSYPNMPLRGSAVGRIRAKGMAERFDLQASFAGEGGELTFTGSADALEPIMGASGAWRARGANLQSLFGDARLPVTSLNATGTVDLRGQVDSTTGELIMSTMTGPVQGSIDLFSRVGEARLFGGTAAMTFETGRLRIDTLAAESSALRLVAQGGLGLAPARRDTLRVAMYVDSLGGLRPWLAPTDTARPAFLLPGDTLRGSVELSAVVAGTTDTTDTNGLDVSLRADARDVVLASTRLRRGALDATIRDVLRRAEGRVDLLADSAVLAGIDVADASAQSTVQGGLAERFGMALRTPNDARITVAGGVTRRGDSTTVRLDSLALRVDSLGERARGLTLASPATVHLVADGGATLDSLVLLHSDTGRITLRGALGETRAVRGTLDVDQLPLADIGRLFPASRLTRGSATAQVTLGGTRELPRLTGSLALRDAVAGPIRLGDLALAARYDSLQLALTGGLRIDNRPALDLEATLPVDLALVANRRRQLDAPLAGRLTSRRADLAVVEALLPSVSEARGTLDADVRLTGSWERPRLRGQVRIDSAAFALDALGIRLDRAGADIALAGDTLIVRRFGASSGAPSDTIGIVGSVVFTDPTAPAFDLRLAASNFLAIDKPRTATLAITTPVPLVLSGPGGAPRVRGAVRVDRGRVYIRQLAQRRALDLSDNLDLIDTARFAMDALLPSTPSAWLQTLQIDDVRLGIGDDLWLRSPEANLKLGGQLRVTRSMSRDGRGARLALADSLTVERGTYQLNLGLARPGFEVERGLVRFYGDPDLQPTLDISALHTVRETRANSNRQDVRIRVNIGGTVDRPTLALTSADNPPLPESDMLSYLVTGEPAYSLLGTPYAEQGATLALRLAGSYLSSRLAGGRFDVVQVEPTALAPGDAANLRQSGLGILASTRVGVGGQVARNTYLTFSTGLCGLAPQSSAGGDALSLFAQGLGVKVERRFDRGVSLSLGLEPGSSAQACGRLGISRTFQQTPAQIGIDFFRFWTF